MMHNPALQPTANPLRGLSAAALGRYVFAVKVRRFRDEQVPTTPGCVCTADGVRDGPVAKWFFGLPGMARWRPRPERVVFPDHRGRRQSAS